MFGRICGVGAGSSSAWSSCIAKSFSRVPMGNSRLTPWVQHMGESFFWPPPQKKEGAGGGGNKIRFSVWLPLNPQTKSASSAVGQTNRAVSFAKPQDPARVAIGEDGNVSCRTRPMAGMCFLMFSGFNMFFFNGVLLGFDGFLFWEDVLMGTMEHQKKSTSWKARLIHEASRIVSCLNVLSPMWAY